MEEGPVTKRRVYGCLFVLILCFIWGNSMLSREMSQAISHLFASVLGGSSEPSEGGHYIVRKLAHFIEFAGLGVVSYLFLDSLTRDKYTKYITIALVGVSVPLIDETIQIFSGRGPALSDVWIDIGGFVAGVALILTIFILLRGLSKKGDPAQ